MTIVDEDISRNRQTRASASLGINLAPEPPSPVWTICGSSWFNLHLADFGV